MNAQTVTVGDALKRLSSRIYLNLKNLFPILAEQDPELRTSELRLFVTRSKKVLFQMLAIMRWLQSSGVMRIFECLSDFRSKIENIENGLNRNLDEVYFLHAGIFSLRSRELQVSDAKNILASGRYSSLPSSIFSCGTMPLPRTFVVANTDNKSSYEKENFRSAIVSELDLLIRAKVFLVDAIPHSSIYGNVLSTSIHNGVLLIDYANYFQVIVTLQHIDINSRWTVLSFSLYSSSIDYMSHSYDFSSIEAEVLRVLRDKVSSSSDVRMSAEENSMVITSNESDLANAVMNVDEEKPTFNIAKMVSLCRHVAVGASLRLLYVQSIAHIELVGKNYVQSAYIDSDKDGSSVVKVDFWMKQSGGYHLFSLKISQLSLPTTHGEGLQLELETWDSVRTFSAADESAMAIIPKLPVANLGDILKGEKFIEKGANFEGLLSEVISVCSQCKLLLICARLLRFAEQKIHSFFQRFHLKLSGSEVQLQRKEEDSQHVHVAITISVESRTGKLVLETFGLRDVLEHSRRIVDLFLAEINNIDSEVFYHSYIQQHGLKRLWDVKETIQADRIVSTSLVADLLNVSSPVSSQTVTFESFCWLLELAWWSNVVKVETCEENHPPLCKLFASPSIPGPTAAVVIRVYKQYIESDKKYELLYKSLFPGCSLATEAAAIALCESNSQVATSEGSNKRRKLDGKLQTASDIQRETKHQESLLLCLSFHVQQEFKLSTFMHLCICSSESPSNGKIEYTVIQSQSINDLDAHLEIITRDSAEIFLRKILSVAHAWAVKYISAPIPPRAISTKFGNGHSAVTFCDFIRHSEYEISLIEDRGDDIEVVFGSMTAPLNSIPQGKEYYNVQMERWDNANLPNFNRYVSMKFTLFREFDGSFQLKCKSLDIIPAGTAPLQASISWELLLFLCSRKILLSQRISMLEDLQRVLVNLVLRLRPLAIFACFASVHSVTSDVLEAISWTVSNSEMPCITFSLSSTKNSGDDKKVLRGYCQVAVIHSGDGRKVQLKYLHSGKIVNPVTLPSSLSDVATFFTVVSAPLLN